MVLIQEEGNCLILWPRGWMLRKFYIIDFRSNGSICYLLLVELYERVIRFKLFSRYTNLVSFLLLRFLWDLHEV